MKVRITDRLTYGQIDSQRGSALKNYHTKQYTCIIQPYYVNLHAF